LTWHLEMAGQLDAVHELMASGEDQNDWFEACDKIGQPGIFVEDVRRGWRLAEELYERDRGRAIVLQCRYALTTGTLNSLAENLSGAIIFALIKKKLWSAEKAWAYLELNNNQRKQHEILSQIIPILPKNLVGSSFNIIKQWTWPWLQTEVLKKIIEYHPDFKEKYTEEHLRNIEPQIDLSKFNSNEMKEYFISLGEGRLLHNLEAMIEVCKHNVRFSLDLLHLIKNENLDSHKLEAIKRLPDNMVMKFSDLIIEIIHSIQDEDDKSLAIYNVSNHIEDARLVPHGVNKASI
jgi:hypothetical protein